jgi:hypothetical protein
MEGSEYIKRKKFYVSTLTTSPAFVIDFYIAAADLAFLYIVVNVFILENSASLLVSSLKANINQLKA